MTDIVTASVKGIVRNATAALFGVSSEAQLPLGAHGQLSNADVHGKWFEANFRGKVFSYNVTGVTVPVVTSGAVSVFSLYNPPGSNTVGELISAQIGFQNATVVVDDYGWYSSTVAATASGTFTSIAQARSGRTQASPANAIKPYSAFTHSGTPTREDIIGTVTATSGEVAAAIQKKYEGELILDIGIAMSVLASTAAGPATAGGVEASWAEWPSQ